MVYDGKDKNAKVSIKDGKNSLKNRKDYSLTYSNNQAIGIASVKIKGTGNYTGTLKKSYKIIPRKITGLKKKSPKKKNSIKAQWNKSDQASGYKIQYSTKSNFNSKKTSTVLIKGSTNISKAINNLPGKTYYYVRVQQYKVAGGKKIFSKCSKPVRVYCNGKKTVA